MLGEKAPDEDPIPNNGNTHPMPLQNNYQPKHPMPLQNNYHPNQHNHFLGPLLHHEHDDVHNLSDLNEVKPLLNLQLPPPMNAKVEMEEYIEDEGVDLPGWVHQTLPQHNQLIDKELHPGAIHGAK